MNAIVKTATATFHTADVVVMDASNKNQFMPHTIPSHKYVSATAVQPATIR